MADGVWTRAGSGAGPRLWLFDRLAQQRGYLFPWSAVFFGAGVGAYFALYSEPGPGDYAMLGLALMIAIILARWLGERYAPMFVAAAVLVAGLMVAGGHAWLSKAPVLGFRYYGPVEGRIVRIDRSLSNRVRITLDQAVLEDFAPARTPARVRITLHGEAETDLRPGMVIGTTANLSPPQGPAEPGGFDFRRHAWFDRLGGVGYTRVPVVRLAPDKVSGFWLHVESWRAELSRAVLARMGGEPGAFAAAIMTGDRSAMSREMVDNLRHSNLAHLLAISGLHMGLLVGFVFAALRYGLALVPQVALNWPVKKIAAFVAILVAIGYLLLSGGAVATMRAFIMVSVMLVAVLLNRRALTLHAVAVAALIVLLIEPEALVGPGFQMSFAATTALVVVFSALRDRQEWFGPRWLRPVSTVVLSSLVAGLATAPFSAAHFNQVAQYGLLANVLAVPMMGAIVVPAGVLATLLAPLGLDWIGFWVMEQGIRWILLVAEWVAGLEGAVYHLPSPSPWVVPLLAAGALIFVIWRGGGRLAGIPVVMIAFMIWVMTPRPLLLISESGGLIGLLGQEGRALNKERGDGFVARSWLENDGDGAGRVEAVARAGLIRDGGLIAVDFPSLSIAHLSGRGGGARLVEVCKRYDLIIYTGRAQVPDDCPVLGERQLRETGSLAVFGTRNVPRLISASDISGARYWTQ